MNKSQKLLDDARAFPRIFGSPSRCLSAGYPGLRLGAVAALRERWRPPSDRVGLRASAPRDGGTT